MKKIILYLIVCLVVIGIVHAVSEGDIITQDQLDSINSDTVNLNCTYNSYEWSRGMKQVLFSFSCYDIEPITGKETYKIIRNYFNPIPYFTFDYVKCRLASSKAVCIKETRLKVLVDFQNRKLQLREHIKSYQTVIDITSDDFIYTSGDLN